MNGLTGTRLLVGLLGCCWKRREAAEVGCASTPRGGCWREQKCDAALLFLVVPRFNDTETTNCFSVRNKEIGSSNAFKNSHPLPESCSLTPQERTGGWTSHRLFVLRYLSGWKKKQKTNPKPETNNSHLSHLFLGTQLCPKQKSPRWSHKQGLKRMPFCLFVCFSSAFCGKVLEDNGS